MINKVLAKTDITTGGIKLENPLKSTSIIEIINNVLNWLIIYSIPILAIMILIGGFQILTAREDPGKVANGRKTIMYAVVGFTIILISKGVALILINIIK
jgi:predicted small integral membrane protein